MTVSTLQHASLEVQTNTSTNSLRRPRLYFNLAGKRMCWQRESEGCRDWTAADLGK